MLVATSKRITCEVVLSLAGTCAAGGQGSGSYTAQKLAQGARGKEMVKDLQVNHFLGHRKLLDVATRKEMLSRPCEAVRPGDNIPSLGNVRVSTGLGLREWH